MTINVHELFINILFKFRKHSDSFFNTENSEDTELFIRQKRFHEVPKALHREGYAIKTGCSSLCRTFRFLW